jgi:hypothetical protein
VGASRRFSHAGDCANENRGHKARGRVGAALARGTRTISPAYFAAGVEGVAEDDAAGALEDDAPVLPVLPVLEPDFDVSVFFLCVCFLVDFVDFVLSPDLLLSAALESGVLAAGAEGEAAGAAGAVEEVCAAATPAANRPEIKTAISLFMILSRGWTGSSPSSASSRLRLRARGELASLERRRRATR